MSVDWSKYPPLPEPPKLPEWRDTPEREAYWEELHSIKHPMDKNLSYAVFCGGLLIITFLASGIAVIDRCGVLWIDCMTYAGLAILIIGPFLILWALIYGIWFQVLQIKMSLRYGFYMFKLKRRDISAAVGEILAARPVFDEYTFRQYWQTPEQAETALLILSKMSDCWIMHNKMLYPNDPLALFFYGRQGWSRRNRNIVDSDCFWEDIIFDFNFTDWDKMKYDSPFAELVEGCIKAAKDIE